MIAPAAKREAIANLQTGVAADLPDELPSKLKGLPVTASAKRDYAAHLFDGLPVLQPE